jgi:hypothetical protein
MVASVEAQEFAEDLGSVEASIANFITTEEVEDMAGSSRTWDFGPSLMMKDMIEDQRKLGVFGEAKAKPPQGETIPKPQAADAVVFKDFFLCGLRFLAARFLRHVLEAFEVQLHHLTCNGIVTLSKFSWAYLSYGAEPNVGTFL